MDGLVCDASPPYFDGDTHYNGSVFLNAMNTLMAAACALTTPEQWPPDRKEEILRGKSVSVSVHDHPILQNYTASFLE